MTPDSAPPPRKPLTVAAAQPSLMGGDVSGNAVRHGEAIVAAAARLVVFPELSLTGYELGLAPLDLDDPDHLALLEPVRDACATAGSIALVGAPVRDRDGLTYLSCLRVDAEGVRIAYRKMCLGGDEVKHFSPGPQPAAIEVDGWRLGLGICKDTGQPQQHAATAALGIHAYVAGLVHHATELDEQDARGRRIAGDHGVFVVFSSFAGSTGEGYAEAAGTSTIWAPTGEVLARASDRPNDVATAVLLPV